MASAYDKASLVMLPHATKEGKVYSVKPEDRSGDFTFTRSTAATRVNADGNIEKETNNQLLHSNSFITSWTGNNSGITGGQLGYDGTYNASKHNATGGYSYRAQFGTYTGVCTFSIYAKAGTAPFIRLYTSSSPSVYTNFDLVNGTIQPSGAIDSKMVDVGNGWYRCSMTFNATNNNLIYFYCAGANGDVSTTTTGDNIYVQHAQLEKGLVARDYIETTTSAVEGGITDNVPRLDYTDSSCPALLLEPQRSNAMPYSEGLEIGLGINYKSSGVTLTANDAESPEGYDNATKFDGGLNDIADTYTGYTASTTNTFSAFLKAGTCDIAKMKHTATGAVAEITINLTSGTITNTTGAQYLDSSIVDYGNGWYRASITFTSGTTAYITRVQLGEAGYIHMYGWQIERGASYPTSYIPTYGTSVTRNIPTLQNLSLGDYIGQTQGTIFVDVEYLDGTGDDVFRINNNVDGIGISKNQNSMVMRNYQSGVRTDTTGSTTADYIKVAYVYTSSGIKMFINGSLNTSRDFSVSFGSTLDKLILYGNPYYLGRSLKRLNQVLVFPTALTDQEAIDLTTL